jgi:hypothetical protein
MSHHFRRLVLCTEGEANQSKIQIAMLEYHQKIKEEVSCTREDGPRPKSQEMERTELEWVQQIERLFSFYNYRVDIDHKDPHPVPTTSNSIHVW